MDIGDQRPSHRRSANNGNMVKYKLLLTGPWAFWFVISEAFRLTLRPCGVPLASDEAFVLQAGAVGCGEEADRLRAGPCIPGTPGSGAAVPAQRAWASGEENNRDTHLAACGLSEAPVAAKKWFFSFLSRKGFILR